MTMNPMSTWTDGDSSDEEALPDIDDFPELADLPQMIADAKKRAPDKYSKLKDLQRRLETMNLEE